MLLICIVLLHPQDNIPLEVLLRALGVFPLGSLPPFSSHTNAVCFDSETTYSVVRNCFEIHGLRKRKPNREFGARRLWGLIFSQEGAPADGYQIKEHSCGVAKKPYLGGRVVVPSHRYFHYPSTLSLNEE